MATLTAGIQIVNLTGLVGILVVAAFLWRRYPDTRSLLVPPTIWGAYGVAFYVLLLLGRLSNDAVLLWGAIHRLLAIYMVWGGLVALWAILYEPGESDD